MICSFRIAKYEKFFRTISSYLLAFSLQKKQQTEQKNKKTYLTKYTKMYQKNYLLIKNTVDD